MRICVLYDCLFPCSIGGAERWYRALVEKFVQEGHDVTYLTLRQWESKQEPVVAGVRVIAVGPRMALYRHGKRRIWPPLRYGLGVFLHLLRHGSQYDHVHGASFPFFSLLAAGMAKRLHPYSIGVDWFEVWTRKYWRNYLGSFGWVGWVVQKLCAKIPQSAFAVSQLHLNRLLALGVAGPVVRLTGGYSGAAENPLPAGIPLRVVYAGRMIPEKRVLLLVEALSQVMRDRDDIRASLFGDGPSRAEILSRVAELDLADKIDVPGFVAQDRLDDAMHTAVVLVQPSEREGYGMVVIESAARGVPVILLEGEDNAAIELVENGRNGYVVKATSTDLAHAILLAVDDAEGLRGATQQWYSDNATRLSIDHSARKILECVSNQKT